ncbi:phospholipase A [Terrimonas sp.]|uniref:phospholipase A n=1 Tax=Terrimonas sp. TaxID=1914338 RepID=UPI00197FEEB5|nr:phospholipase A [Terrimonas sp.]
MRRNFFTCILNTGLFLITYQCAAQTQLFSGEVRSTSMAERWELDTNTRKKTFLITPYKPVYITAGRWSNNPNEQPVSENPNYSLPFKVDYGNYEAKFQLSFKTKVIRGVFFNHGDLWVAYTQKSHWQIYNKNFSRPFRETNYEPEVILNFATNFNLLGFRTRMFGLIFNHQSNGRSLPLSRSWNRVMLQAGFENRRWNIFLRPWYRLPDKEDENPAIADYVGRAEAVVIYNIKGHQLALSGNHPLKFNNRGRGRIQFDWTFPVVSNLKINLQLADGYGETLVDYNHKQTTIGVSVALIEW